MLNYFMNRAGRNLNPARRRTLQRAKTMLSERIRKSKERSGSRKWRVVQGQYRSQRVNPTLRRINL